MADMLVSLERSAPEYRFRPYSIMAMLKLIGELQTFLAGDVNSHSIGLPLREQPDSCLRAYR